MISAKVRRTVRTLYAFSCGYCGVSETEVGAFLTIDHFHPSALGGSDDINNLVYACHACNLHKAATWSPQTPQVLHPLRTEMRLHITELPDGTLRDITPEGKIHLSVLNLNRPPMIERRKMKRLIEQLVEIRSQLIVRDELASQEIATGKKILRRKKRTKR